MWKAYPVHVPIRQLGVVDESRMGEGVLLECVHKSLSSRWTKLDREANEIQMHERASGGNSISVAHKLVSTLDSPRSLWPAPTSGLRAISADGQYRRGDSMHGTVYVCGVVGGWRVVYIGSLSHAFPRCYFRTQTD
jgi:hypothetical protein